MTGAGRDYGPSETGDKGRISLRLKRLFEARLRFKMNVTVKYRVDEPSPAPTAPTTTPTDVAPRVHGTAGVGGTYLRGTVSRSETKCADRTPADRPGSGRRHRGRRTVPEVGSWG